MEETAVEGKVTVGGTAVEGAMEGWRRRVYWRGAGRYRAAGSWPRAAWMTHHTRAVVNVVSVVLGAVVGAIRGGRSGQLGGWRRRRRRSDGGRGAGGEAGPVVLVAATLLPSAISGGRNHHARLLALDHLPSWACERQ